MSLNQTIVMITLFCKYQTDINQDRCIIHTPTDYPNMNLMGFLLYDAAMSRVTKR